MVVRRWDPFRDLLGIQNEMNRLFGRTYGPGESAEAETQGSWVPPLDVYETQDRYIIELNTETEVKNFIPDFGILRYHNCILTSLADPDSPYDFVSRYFAGANGIKEDAATGSSHCSLIVFKRFP